MANWHDMILSCTTELSSSQSRMAAFRLPVGNGPWPTLTLALCLRIVWESARRPGPKDVRKYSDSFLTEFQGSGPCLGTVSLLL